MQDFFVTALLERTPTESDRAQPLLEASLAAARQYGFAGIERDALRFV